MYTLQNKIKLKREKTFHSKFFFHCTQNTSFCFLPMKNFFSQSRRRMSRTNFSLVFFHSCHFSVFFSLFHEFVQWFQHKQGTWQRMDSSIHKITFYSFGCKAPICQFYSVYSTAVQVYTFTFYIHKYTYIYMDTILNTQ